MLRGVRWTDIPVHVIDFEGSRASGVVEFGVVTLHGGQIVAANTRTCRPRSRLTPDDTRVHGLTEHELARAEPFEAEWTRFAALRASGVLAAHFSGTENALLRATWPCPRLSPDFLHPGREVAEWGPWIDTGRMAAERKIGAASAALGELVVAFGLEERLRAASERWCPQARCRFHCALYDALASALLLQRLACDVDGPWSLARTLAASTADRERRDASAQGELF